ncbi:tissue factor [Tiliqua scincoides]|uniref:tissue factor n=1 Tax=Tiliqua scincoides TaxID=71010 RepID=UPI00346339C0
MVATPRRCLAAATACGRALLLCALLALVRPGSGNSDIQTAVNITWSSTNFKTLLLWEPKPTNYVYTVEIDGDLSDVKKTCVHTTKTECDVTKLLKNVRDTYVARIYSEVPYSDQSGTPPYAISSPFRPYSQTEIGTLRIDTFEQNGTTLKVVVEDPLTPYRFENRSLKSIRDIFKSDLEYTLHYWKDQSTGKKIAKTKSYQFDIEVDKDNNYCFYVQATILSRSQDRTSQKSVTKCTSVVNDNSALEFDMILIIAGTVIGIVILIVVLSVVICKCTKSKDPVKEKENVPLNV